RSEVSALGARWLLPTRSQPPNYRHLRGWQRGSSRPTPHAPMTLGTNHVSRAPRTDLWPQLFSDVSCIALWISSEKILTRLYSVLHWFHNRLEANVKKPRENRCFQTVIV